MKKKTKVFATLLLLCFFLSSCVYSLFPIYTDDTLVYLPEIVGKWKTGEDPDDYILFERMQEDERDIEEEEGAEVYTDSLSGNGWKVRFNDPATDKDSVRTYFDSIISKISNSKGQNIERDSQMQKSTIHQLLDGTKKKGRQGISFDGSFQVVRGESYRMTVLNSDERLVYQAHLVQIGHDMFLDLYPLPEYSDAAFGENMFPVHTFMKLKLNGNKLDLTQFDLDKLNKLFKSNLIRLRHENVDGTILITAQPKELQKFLGKYSEDESVFEDPETYTRVAQ